MPHGVNRKRTGFRVPSGPPRSPIAHDDALAAFIISAAKRMPQVEIPKACFDRFGPGRAPSLSAVNRYLTTHTTVAERTLKRPPIPI